MNKLQALNLKHAPQWQRDRLAAWLREWETIRILEQGDHDVTDGTEWAADKEHTIDSQVAPFDSDIEPGQVRLLAPTRGLPSNSRPLHVLVLCDEGDMGFLVAPFSRFAEPALPGELLFDGPAPALAVVCAWNARLLPREALRGWGVAALAADLLRDCMAVYAHARSGARLPTHLHEQVGPPLTHPQDPRHVYCDEERDVMDALCAANSASPASVLIYPTMTKDALPRAAEDRTQYPVGDSE